MCSMAREEDMRWKVGELARATGLTVRALHHYDNVGLLVPSQRTAGGHRVYDAQDARRLYRILALRRLGFRLDEIASLLDEGGVSLLETVRRHLEQVERELERQHRLRERLSRMLDALQRSAEPPVDDYLNAVEAMTMIEIDVQDVVMRVPFDEADKPARRTGRESLRVVLLEERDGERTLPIWIGAPEADALVYARSQHEHPRPLGPDLTAKLLQAAGARVERVVIDSLREHTFIATVVIAAGGGSQEVDARPSDALNLAERLHVPVLVAAEVMDHSGIDSSRLPSTAATTGDGPHDTMYGEWRSATPQLIASLQPRLNQELIEHVTAWAREEAQKLGHDHVGPEHILLGLLRDPGDRTSRLLDALGITIDLAAARARAAVFSAEPSDDQIALTPAAEKVFKVARLNASLGSNEVGAEHILLGLAAEHALLEYGVTTERLGEEVRRVLADEATAGA